MTWDVVARKDFEDAVRAKTLWALVALFTIVMVLSTWFFGDVQSAGNTVAAEALIISLVIPVSFILPAMGIMAGYKAIVGERDSGSIKVLLSLPNTRGNVLLGKFLGRSAVVSAAVLLGCVVGAIVFAVFAGEFAAAAYLQFLVLTLVLGVVFVGISVGFSASTSSSTVAIIGGIGLVLLFTLFWNLLTLLLGFILSEYGNLASETITDVVGFTNSINPTNAYNNLLLTVIDQENAGGGVGAMPDGFYTEPWFAVVVLAFWLVVPLAVGYWRFTNAEL
jgi:ABC-2 type transport system permease protein